MSNIQELREDDNIEDTYTEMKHGLKKNRSRIIRK